MSTAAERVRVERAAQGLPTPAAPIGDDVVDARVAAAYRTTATLVTSARTSPDRTTPHVQPAAGEVLGAAGEVRGEVASTGRSNKKRTPAATGVLHDNGGQRTAAGEA